MIDKKFDTLAWSYDQRGLLHFREALAQTMGVRWFVDECFKTFELGGGKAFGLRLCERIATVDHRIHVPTWHIPKLSLENLDRWLSFRQHVIVRSSESAEDWLDSASGAKTSTVHWSPELLDKPALYAGDVVVQQQMAGIGFVVDIGYSELLEYPVVRIAHGNTSRESGGVRYTSATWDKESHVGLYSLQGEEIVPLRHRAFDIIAPELVRVLVHGVQQLGITFGVQLELIIHPDSAGERWHLVQVRPSPAAVQWDFTPLDVMGVLLETTGKVSGCGSCEGDVAFLRDYAELERADVEGKVVVWNAGRLYRGSVDGVQASLSGAVGQVFNHSMLCNSGHGTFGSPSELDLENYNLARQNCLMVAAAHVPSPAYHGWRRDVAESRIKRLRLVSDGLVCQIFEVT